MIRIRTRRGLIDLAAHLGVSPDWHEPDEQNVAAQVRGQSFDNAGFWGTKRDSGQPHEEMQVIFYHEGRPCAVVNLATLCAWATGYEA
jgi:hypothetical protein